MRSKRRWRSIRATARAFVAMARVAMKQKLYGQAIRYQQGARARADRPRRARGPGRRRWSSWAPRRGPGKMLAKLQKLCAGGCPQAATLSAAIARGPTLAAAKPAAGDDQEELSRRRARETRRSRPRRAFRRGARVDAQRCQRVERAGHALEALAQHLAALAEGGGGEPLEHRVADARRASAPGTMWTTARRHLGRRDEGASGGPAWRSARSTRHWAATASRP